MSKPKKPQAIKPPKDLHPATLAFARALTKRAVTLWRADLDAALAREVKAKGYVLAGDIAVAIEVIDGAYEPMPLITAIDDAFRIK